MMFEKNKGNKRNTLEAMSLVTQPMLQLRPNCTELRWMDYFLKIPKM